MHEDLAEQRTIFSTRVYAATIIGDAPPFEKFYAGGENSLRGFEYRGVSTRGLQTNVPNPEREDPIGSDWIFLANAEVTVPLVSEKFAALFFVDSGTIDTGDYRVSVGGGLQIQMPQWFGPVPMRFELGFPVMKSDGRPGAGLQFFSWKAVLEKYRRIKLARETNVKGKEMKVKTLVLVWLAVAVRFACLLRGKVCMGSNRDRPKAALK